MAKAFKRKHDKSAIEQGLALVESGISLRKAAEQVQIPTTVLWR
jgi:hypothetical protein